MSKIVCLTALLCFIVVFLIYVTITYRAVIISDSSQNVESVVTNFNRFLEYEGLCNDIDILTNIPRNVFESETTNKYSKIDDDNLKDSETEAEIAVKGERRATGAGGGVEICMVYAAVALLIVSVLKASADVYKARRESIASSAGSDLSRRCSLAELTVSRHARKEPLPSPGGHASGRRLSILTRNTPVLPTPKSGIGFNAAGSDTPEASSVNMAIKLLGGRPPPLIRRSSFPASMKTTTPKLCSASMGASIGGQGAPPAWGSPLKTRRPSIDSEDDSSTDSRRRVRLIRRH